MNRIQITLKSGAQIYVDGENFVVKSRNNELASITTERSSDKARLLYVDLAEVVAIVSDTSGKLGAK